MIAMDLNTKMVMAKLMSLQKSAPKAATMALEATGFELMRLSQYEVPHDEGSLQNSGAVEIIGQDVVFGYHEPYAARLHEHPEYRFQKGRKGKFIEDPIARNENALNMVFGQEFQMRLF